MTARLAAGLAIGALLTVWLWRGASVSVPPAAAPARPPGASRPSPGATPEPQRLARDPFRYADARPARHDPAPPPVLPPASPLAMLRAPEPEVRLTGFARRSGVLKAVLNLQGSVAVVAPGETVEGYRVLSVDEEKGVRLLQPDGLEITLLPSDR